MLKPMPTPTLTCADAASGRAEARKMVAIIAESDLLIRIAPPFLTEVCPEL
jgi:hypothetical protein